MIEEDGSVVKIGPRIQAPSNSSRFFSKRLDALKQPYQEIQLAYSIEDKYLYNCSYDESQIKYDDLYCTTVSDMNGDYSIPTFNYIPRLMKYLPDNPCIIDIGCGQGNSTCV